MVMPPSATADLKKLLQRYRDTRADISAETWRECVQPVTADQIYTLLLEVKNRVGRTAIHFGATRGDDKMIECLLSRLSPDQIYTLLKVKTVARSTAIHFKAMCGDFPSIELLLSRLSADQIYKLLQVQNSVGRTAIHFAALKADNNKMIECLLNKLSSYQRLKLLDMKNREGRTAQALATDTDHPVAAEYLQECRHQAAEQIQRREDAGMNMGIL